jgi:hypothetical protein
MKVFGRTGWLLVLVYFGALTAISGFVASWFLFSQEVLYYEVFFEVVVSTAILYALSKVYGALRDKSSTSKWWIRGVKILAIVFGLMGAGYLSIGLVLFLSLDMFGEQPDIGNLDSEMQHFIVQQSFQLAILFVISSIIAFLATAGLSRHHKVGWYAAVSLVLFQIVAITGLLDKERAIHFVLPQQISSHLTSGEINQIETIFVPVLMNGVFALIVANIVIVTFLTLPKILTIFNMPPDILSARISKGH